jgi:hypothetical protein
MLRDAYEHLMEQGGKDKIGKFVSLYRPCPRIGDLRVLNGLALRGLMTDGDHNDVPHRVEVWPRWIRITAAGVAEWERILAARPPIGPQREGTP